MAVIKASKAISRGAYDLLWVLRYLQSINAEANGESVILSLSDKTGTLVVNWYLDTYKNELDPAFSPSMGCKDSRKRAWPGKHRK